MKIFDGISRYFFFAYGKNFSIRRGVKDFSTTPPCFSQSLVL